MSVNVHTIFESAGNSALIKPAPLLTEVSEVEGVLHREREHALHEALERSQFALHYQPKVDLATGAIIGAEALLRWSHPTQGLLGPGRFLPEAERFGLMPSIDGWVVREACRQARAWRDQGLPDATMAVNVSATQFTGDGFLRSVIDILDDTGLNAAALELEFSESVLRAHGDEMGFVLQVLRSVGVNVAIDDFGKFDPSLAGLKRYPITSVKIDPSLVRSVTSSADAGRAMNEMITAGHDLNLKLVAEGVETGEQLGVLTERHFDEAQGYFFSRPVDSNGFASLLSRGIGRRRSGEE